MPFWDRIDEIANRHDVLRHPFYVRWSEGALSRAELACYAGQYRYAVRALADAAASAAQSCDAGDDAPALAKHAAEEADHERLWDEFVLAVGGELGAAPTAETRECCSTWRGDGSRPLLQSLAAMYPVESAQPAIAKTKREGLTRHYGISESSYFSVHEQLDVEHAAEARELIEARLDVSSEDELVAAAEAALTANWTLLDGVERLTASGAAA